MSAGIKANVDGSAAIQVGGTDVITLTSGGAATFVTSPTTVQAGTAAAPSITFSGDTNTGIYSPGADTIAFTEGGVESARFDSAGDLLIGNTSSFNFSHGGTGKLVNVYNSGTSINSQAHVLLGSNASSVANSAIGSISWGLPNASAANKGVAYIGVNTGSDSTSANPSSFMAFATRATTDSTFIERASITSGGDLRITNGNLVIGTSGKGVDFSVTPGTGTSELLDDYEEGTWTPTDGSGAGLSFSSVGAIYCKIGRLVIAQASYVYPSTSSGAQARMSGLPFPSTTEGGGFCMYSTAGVGFVIRNETNATNTFFTNVTSPSAAVSNAALSNASIQVTFIYQTTT